jgi:hypothetical protein
MLGEMQQAPLDERVRIIGKSANQFRLFAAEIFVHLCSPIFSHFWFLRGDVHAGYDVDHSFLRKRRISRAADPRHRRAGDM